MIKLRDYQKNQLNFINSKINLTDILSIESPTGSGKTYVFFQFIKDWLSKKENQLTNVVITTGFNNLVYSLEQRAIEYGLSPKILIGYKAMNCPEIMKENNLDYKPFTYPEQYHCNHKNENGECQSTLDKYAEYSEEIKNGVGQLIITNHSTFLARQQLFKNASLLIVDEAHTFDNFYSTYVNLTLDQGDLMQLDQSINRVKEPMRSIIKLNMRNRKMLPTQQVTPILNATEDVRLKAKFKNFFETQPQLNNYIEHTSNSITIHKFYKMFELEIRPKIVLFSATIDAFTQNMFGVNKAFQYREYTQFCDYSKSEFIAIPNEDYEYALKQFLDYVDLKIEKENKSGLVLCTTITDVNRTKKYDGYLGFKMFDDISSFVDYKGKKILVGSRALFQGVDIPSLDFVSLNKIPFPNWDEKNQALQEYLTDRGRNNFDPWKQFTIPKTENDIIQSTGRLWRALDSKGIVSIFDHRIEKFSYIIRDTMDIHRHGIKINIMDENGVRPFKI